MIKTGLLPVQIDSETYNILCGEEMFELQVDLENDSKDVLIVLNEGQTVLKAVHLLNNSYEIEVFKSGGILRQSLNGFLKSPSSWIMII